MKKILIALLVVFSYFTLSAPTTEAADPPLPNQPNSDFFDCCVSSNKAQAEFMQTGVWRWRYEVNTSCSGTILPALIDALETISKKHGVLVLHDPVNGHIVKLNCGAEFAMWCGTSSGVAACLGHKYPTNVTLDVNHVVATYVYETQVSILLHELLHAMFTWNEQYLLGSGISCAPNWFDFMNCGPQSRHRFLDIETQRWARTVDPCYREDCFLAAGRDSGGAFIYWRNQPLGYKVAFLACRPDGFGGCASYRWMYTAATTSYRVNDGIQGWRIGDLPLEQGEIPCINIENGTSTWTGRNDRCVMLPPASVEDMVRDRFVGESDGAACVAWLESRFDPIADNPDSDALGVMQVIYYWHSELIQSMGYSEQDLLDPWRNVRIAKAIRDGWGGWNHWPVTARMCGLL